MARLILERIHHYRDTIRPYVVTLDGEQIGTIKDSQREEFDVAAGQHELRVRNLWISSPKTPIEVAPDGETWVRLGPSGGILSAWRLFLAPATNMFIEQLPGPPDEIDAD